MKLFFSFLLVCFFTTHVQAQTKEIDNEQELFKALQYPGELAELKSVKGVIYTIGKAIDAPLRALDSQKKLKRKNYVTALSLSLLNDSTRYYMPIANKSLKRIYKILYHSSGPQRALFEIRIFPVPAAAESPHFFTIENVRLLRN